jgi:glycosyltransferase involved in cell wall biosynthesis
MNKLIVFPHRPGSGGPGSFQKRFEIELKRNGFQIGYLDQNDIKPDLIFIVGGTKKIGKLLKWKRKNVPIMFRLDGINWLHRVPKTHQNTLKNYIHSEIINLIGKITHAYISDFIIYQSNFVKNWWDEKGFVKRENYSIIHNGVDMDKFTPNLLRTQKDLRIVILEGVLDYSPYAIDLINELADEYGDKLEVYGGIKFEAEKRKISPKVNYKGSVGFNDTPEVYNNSIYLSLDVNPACPNTVIEALSCGAPVVAYDTGAIKELLTVNSGIFVDYGSDPWKLDYPNVKNLKVAIQEIFSNYDDFSANARKHALENFSIQKISNDYIRIIEKCLKL